MKNIIIFLFDLFNKYYLDFCELKQERFILFDQPGIPFTDWFVRQNKPLPPIAVLRVYPQLPLRFLLPAPVFHFWRGIFIRF